jgi:hypothetical protein
MATTSTIVMSSFVVRDDNGINVESTEQKFHNHLLKYIAESQTEQSNILSAINSVFEENHRTNMNTQFVLNESVRKMNGASLASAAYGILLDKVKSTIKSNSGTKESGAIFGTKKGKNGGIFRWCDINESNDSK